jgi:hypothetical protein
MNKKNLIYILILGVLVLLFIYNKTRDYSENIVNLFSADSAKIGLIELSSATDTIKIAKSGDDWMLEYPLNFPAKKSQVDNFFSKVLKAQYSDIPLSEQEDSWAEFKVNDSLGTLVRIYDSSKSKILDEVYVGQSSNYSTSNVRRANKNAVYQTKESITYQVKSDPKNWRKNKLHDFKRDEITNIMFKGNELDYMLAASDTTWQYNDISASYAIKKDNSKLSGLLSSLENLQTRDFIDNDFVKYEEKFNTPLYTLEVKLFDGKSMLFKIIHDDEDEKKFIIMRDEETDTLYKVGEHSIKQFYDNLEGFNK